MVTAEWDRMSHGPRAVAAYLSRRTGLHRQPLQPTVCAVLSGRAPRVSKLQAAHLSFSRSDECATSVCNAHVG